MNKTILRTLIFFIGTLTSYSQDLEKVLQADTIYVNINKGFSVIESKSSKSVHLPCYKYYHYNDDYTMSFNTCKWLDEDPPKIKIIDSIFLKDKIVIDLDFIKKSGFKLVSRKFKGKKFYVIKNKCSNKEIELTEAEFVSTYEGSGNDTNIKYFEVKKED